MVTSSQSRRSGDNGPVLRSLSTCGRFPASHCNSYYSSSPSLSAFASSTSSCFATTPSTFFPTNDRRSASPTLVNLSASSPFSTSFRFSVDRSVSPSQSITVTKNNPISPLRRRACVRQPHPGSFRCSLHKKVRSHGRIIHDSYTPHRLNMRRSAMTNSLVRIGGVEGEWVKRALTALIRPSSHQLRRRGDFQSRPSRLSIMCNADDH
ncbi:hypothetical protein K2173_025915 [Erythroxylum novogranatense]|uniref:Uncharacterized protein n=1 Tax=Erythroxylum novogranatense TaxID=1862640 RepID=A0AAV8SIA0_9ROSI|nr:hypothetical protein K2173_025915 [Erythroxylum novogranatense]